MCTTCGCEGATHEHDHKVGMLDPVRLAEANKKMRVEQDLLSKNKALAEKNRTWLKDRRLAAESPHMQRGGSGLRRRVAALTVMARMATLASSLFRRIRCSHKSRRIAAPYRRAVRLSPASRGIGRHSGRERSLMRDA